jgi:hypothetical protein
MTGQPPWRGPQGQGYPPLGQPPPKKDQEKQSLSDALQKWLSTTGGLITAGVAVAGLLIGGTVVTVKVITPSPTVTSHQPVTPGTTPPNSTPPNPPHPAPAKLANALLPVGVLGSAALMQAHGTDLSTVSGICGGPTTGATSIAYEAIQNNQQGMFLNEILISWGSAQDASQAITNDRQAVDRSGSCSNAVSGSTETYTGDYSGAPPSSCESPGQYLATSVETTSPSAALPYQGFLVEAQCGTTTITAKVESNLPGVTQQTADGFLSQAIGKLDSATSGAS